MPLNLERARQAIHDHVAVPLGLDLYEAAAGIVQIVNNNMVGALRVVSVEKGTIRSVALVALEVLDRCMPATGAAPGHADHSDSAVSRALERPGLAGDRYPA